MLKNVSHIEYVKKKNVKRCIINVNKCKRNIKNSEDKQCKRCYKCFKTMI